MILKDIFSELAGKYANNSELIETLWLEIDKKYSGSGRHYHTLSHLENLICKLEEVKDKISDWDLVLFSVFYHDIVYISTRGNNEEKSADLAKSRLAKLNLSNDRISKCIEMILATKKHTQTGDDDIDLFTDADLSILGQDWDVYSNYFQQVRKEYSIYPDIIYKPGRKKVLDHFLQMERIFKTSYFYEKLEAKARENLAKEKELYQ